MKVRARLIFKGIINNEYSYKWKKGCRCGCGEMIRVKVKNNPPKKKYSHKRWEILLTPRSGGKVGQYMAIMSWGPATSISVKNTKIFKNLIIAMEYYNKKVKEKIRKGYKVCHEVF